MTEIGKVCESARSSVFEWKIYNFFGLSDKVNKHYVSPSFYFADTDSCWYFSVYPNGQWKCKSAGFIDVSLHKVSGPPISLEVFLGLKTRDENIDKKCHLLIDFLIPESLENSRFIHRSELWRRKSYLLPRNVLTLVCEMKFHPTDEIRSAAKVLMWGEIETEAGWSSDDDDDDQADDYFLEKCMDKSSKCGSVVQLDNLHDHRRKMAEKEASEKLLSDLKEMMISGDHSDMVITVKGEEFRLHKNILAARNTYFYLMFKNDMKEKATGVVTINDCEPEIFRTFIHFLYTGETDALSQENVCDLYRVADKYQENHLKEECLYLMLNSISVDTICDFIIIALMYNEKKLLEETTEFFCRKAKEIIRNVKWQTFLAKFPTEANELYIKALDNLASEAIVIL